MEWSNDAALGYMLLAAERLGYSVKQKNLLLREMYFAFDFKTVEEAAKHYRKK